MFSSSANDISTFHTALADEQATRKLMRDVATLLQPGDVVTLSGDLGAGKSTFARALIRHFADDETIEVPSPSFTLIQEYALPPFPLVHADLYRLHGAVELAELGFDDLPSGAVVLVEWPDRAAGFLPRDRLDIALTLEPARGPTHRNARVTGYGAMAQRLERAATLRRFLAKSGFGEARRRRMQGDASTRAYERLTLNNRDYILMNAPRRPDGPPLCDGKPYSAIVHLAEDVAPFVAMSGGLRERGFSAPQVLHADLDAGLLILEDLGTRGITAGTPPAPVEGGYAAAADVLAALHALELPDRLPVTDTIEHVIPHFDIEAMLVEAELLLDWYLPMRGMPPTEVRRAAYLGLWREALQPALAAPSTWVLRDYHSPNLLWLPQRTGLARVGLLDFQDAVMGPAAYDVASLLQDARVDVPEAMEISLFSHYTRARRARDSAFDAAEFARLYATMAAQRASKILGIFARLERRDGKPQYLRHMPRVDAYLQRALSHPALEALKAWYGANVPRVAPPAA